MPLNESEVRRYRADGFLELGPVLAPAEVALLREEARLIGSPGRPLVDANLVDAESGTIWRSYAMDRDSEAFRLLTRLPRILEPVRALLGEDVYLWQAHMNHKPAARGEAWHWHQDYANWCLDGLPRGGLGDVVTVVVMLDDSTPDNGPLKAIRGSQTTGPGDGYWDVGSGRFDVQAVPAEQLAALTRERETVAFLGPAGSALLMSGLTVHGSERNLSHRPRCIAYLAYARDDNGSRTGPRCADLGRLSPMRH